MYVPSKLGLDSSHLPPLVIAGGDLGRRRGNSAAILYGGFKAWISATVLTVVLPSVASGRVKVPQYRHRNGFKFAICYRVRAITVAFLWMLVSNRPATL